jgi:hypothetical protein
LKAPRSRQSAPRPVDLTLWDIAAECSRDGSTGQRAARRSDSRSANLGSVAHNVDPFDDAPTVVLCDCRQISNMGIFEAVPDPELARQLTRWHETVAKCQSVGFEYRPIVEDGARKFTPGVRFCACDTAPP